MKEILKQLEKEFETGRFLILDNGSPFLSYEAIRQYIKEKLNQKTFHGIPKNLRSLQKLCESYELQAEGSKGYLSEKHVANHNIKGKGEIMDYITSVQGACSPNRQPNKLEKEAKRAQNPSRQLLRAGGSGRLFSVMMRNSPFAKRIKNGVVRFKQIRPLQIMLGPKKKLTKDKNGNRMHKQVIARVINRAFTKALKMQVVLPSKD